MLTVLHCLTLRQVVKLGQASEFARQQVEEAGHEDSSARGLLQDYGATPTMATLRTPRTPATHDAILQVTLCCQCDFSLSLSLSPPLSLSLSLPFTCMYTNTHTHTHMMPFYIMLCVSPPPPTHAHICTQCHTQGNVCHFEPPLHTHTCTHRHVHACIQIHTSLL